MEITNGTIFGKKNEAQPDGYEWAQYGKIFIQEVGHHKPTIEQLNEAGWLLRVTTVYDPATHRLVPGIWSDNGLEISQDTIALTPAELEANTAIRLAGLEKEIVALTDEKVNGHIDPVEKAHWMGVEQALARKHRFWLEEFTIADIESRMPDEVTYPPLTQEEKELSEYLSTIQKLTAAIRQTAKDIAMLLYMMTDEQINALPSDWVTTHILWP